MQPTAAYGASMPSVGAFKDGLSLMCGELVVMPGARANPTCQRNTAVAYSNAISAATAAFTSGCHHPQPMQPQAVCTPLYALCRGIERASYFPEVSTWARRKADEPSGSFGILPNAIDVRIPRPAKAGVGGRRASTHRKDCARNHKQQCSFRPC